MHKAKYLGFTKKSKEENEKNDCLLAQVIYNFYKIALSDKYVRPYIYYNKTCIAIMLLHAKALDKDETEETIENKTLRLKYCAHLLLESKDLVLNSE